MAKRIPSYRLHKASGQAVVVIRGESHYLGQFDTPESRERYERLICEYKAKLHQESVSGRYTWTCNQLIVAYLEHANLGTVKPDGKGLWKQRDLLHAHMSGKTFPTRRGKLTLNADGSVSVNGAGWGEWMPMNDYDIYIRLEGDQIVIIACRGLTDAANIARGRWPYQYYEVARGFTVGGTPIKPLK